LAESWVRELKKREVATMKCIIKRFVPITVAGLVGGAACGSRMTVPMDSRTADGKRGLRMKTWRGTGDQRVSRRVAI
jgi:hypothetical protein